LRKLKATYGRGKYRVEACYLETGRGIVMCLVGGDRPHVGALALAIPRPSLKDPSKLSSSTSVLTLMGHKEDEIVKPVAEKLAKELNQPVVVVAGLHIDEASEEDIKRLKRGSFKVAERVLRRLRGDLRDVT